MIAEGAPFDISQTIDTSGLVGAVSSTVHWGDGRQSPADVSGANSGGGNLKIRFDYSLDSRGFFKSPARRTLLQTAADGLIQRFTDDLAAIQPSGTNSWSAVVHNPTTGTQKSISNPTIRANELVIYAGARDLSGSQLGEGGPGAWTARGSQSWLTTVKARGEAGALKSPPTDFAPWGGSVAFDTGANWYFGTDPDGLQAGQHDFMTVAQHELAHLLGIGVSDSWRRLVSGGRFTGSQARAAHDGAGDVPLASSGSHFASGVEDNGQEALMTSSVSTGTRKLPTPLDFAALDDIGWDVAKARATVTATHTYADNGQYPVEILVKGGRYGEITRTLSAGVTNVAPQLTVVPNQQVVRGRSLSLTDLGQISDPGYRNRASNPPTTETFSYTVNWGDGSSVVTGNATIDRFGSATANTLASFDASHTYHATGRHTVTVTVTDDDGGTARKSFTVDVLEPPRLMLQVDPSTFPENAGAAAATVTVTRSGPATDSAQTVSLASSDPSEATVPASVVIPAGETSVTAEVRAVGDRLLDGNQTVELSAGASGLEPDTVDLVVADYEFLEASFNRESIAEDAAVDELRLTVARSNTDVDSALEVAVSGGAPTELVVPTTVTIPAGQQQVTVALVPADDDVAERDQRLAFTFVADGYDAATAEITLIDDEPPRFQNPDNRLDVSADGRVTALDALRVINALTRHEGAYPLDPADDQPEGNYYDVNGDYQVSALDALLVINALNRQSAAGESLLHAPALPNPLEQQAEDESDALARPIPQPLLRWSLF